MVIDELGRSLLLCMSIGLFCGCSPEQSKNMATATTDAMTMPILDRGLSETSDTSMRGRPDDSIRDLGFSVDAMSTIPDAIAVNDAGDAALAQDAADAERAPDGQIIRDSEMIPADEGPPEPQTRAEQIAQILMDFGLEQMRIRLPEADIDRQEQDYPGPVNFNEALVEAIDSFLNDGSDLESPRSLASDVRDGPCLQADLTERVRCFLNRDTAFLELYGSEGFAPENREPIEQNWIFILRAESLSDHIQWAIVDRSGARPTFNYGFN